MKFRELFNKEALPDWEKIREIPQFAALIGNEQSHVWHKEGDVWEHTKLVTNAMISLLALKGVKVASRDYLVLVSAAICHDIAKPVTREWDEVKKDWSSPNHGHVGARMVRDLFFDEDVQLREEVCFLVDMHMIPHHLLEKGETMYLTAERLSLCYRPFNDLVLLNLCDNLGSKNDNMSVDKALQHAMELMSLTKNRGEHQTLKISDLARLNGIKPDKIWKSDNMTYVFILVGLPGSGKNYYLDTHFKDNVPDSIGILSRDDIRTEIGLTGEKPQGNKGEEERVTEIFEQRLKEYCKTKATIFINNVNVKKKYRKRFLEILSENTDGVITYIYFNTDVETCKKRRAGMMPLEVINRMNNNFDFPQLYECSAMYYTNGDMFMEKLIQNGKE